MAVEKMKVFGMIGSIKDMNKALRLALIDGSIHMINALSYLNSSNFMMPPSEENVEALKEMPFLKPITKRRDFTNDEKVIKKLLEVFDLKETLKLKYLEEDYDYDKYIEELNMIYKQIESKVDELDKKNKEIDKLKAYMSNLEHLKYFNIDINMLTNLKYLSFKLISLSRENFKKLQKNYDNVPAIVKRLDDHDGNIILYAITPKVLNETVERIFSSLNYTELELPKDYSGNSMQVISIINDIIIAKKKEIDDIIDSIKDIKREYLKTVKAAYTRLSVEKKIEEMKTDIAYGNNLFFMFGYVPVNRIEGLKKMLYDSIGGGILLIDEDAKNLMPAITPPTHLKNNWLFKPFETLVKMYGVPTYNEKDPTPFFAITYMLLFGAMFGDVGQGLIGFLGGLLLNKKMKNSNFGGILERLGLTSMIFGILYGSVFGSEKIIPALLLRPMLNINTMLLSAVVLGIILITIGFVYGIYNSKLNKNIKEGIFGRNGITGLVFYWDLLITALCVVNGTYKYIELQVIIMVVCLILMLFKEPLSNILMKSKKLYNEPVSDYYVEEGFGVIETILSMVSNTISFIRVGAFALNHVGLYVAFATMANMMNTRAGSILMLIIGNVVIIGLEGLIVFIQALRLEFYELFSKYFIGDGIEYEPVHLNFTYEYRRAKRETRKLKLSKQAYSLLSFIPFT
ncbi:V-type ATPase 116kDa subunit family protein [Thermoanaerobacterium sp. RBIITD]|uniref:V-type ATP synthase subunit I n=1 Tax=Thermoanaerobacterium sp. RBIITD TaxID=1550240 RepID=UPI000BB7851A|nr:V-type ATPase 116kDa subunit family protein [Thermoanaerobacterium sp. RBIITD]SNX53441.1 V/A-type H+-transporting ATPase subunit I [Thermoanaerobacterium sp. RBIITD]